MRIYSYIFLFVFMISLVSADLGIGLNGDLGVDLIPTPPEFDNNTQSANTTVTDSWTRTGTNVHLTNVGDDVGIGTSAPTHKLNVVGSVNVTGGLIINDDGSDDDVRIEGLSDVNLFVTDAGFDVVTIGRTAGDAGAKLDVLYAENRGDTNIGVRAFSQWTGTFTSSSASYMGLNAFAQYTGTGGLTHSSRGLVAGRYGLQSFGSASGSTATINHAYDILADGGFFSGSMNIDYAGHLKLDSFDVDATNIKNLYGIWKTPATIGAGSVVNNTGIWLEKETIGTNNFGIVLDGDGSGGSGIFFGASQDSQIYYNGNNLIVNPDEVGAGLLEVDGDLNVTGNFTGNQYYGEMWFHNDSSTGQPTQIDSAGTWYNVSFGFVQVEEAGGTNNGFTFDSAANGSLVVDVSGLYKVDYSISFQRLTGGTGREFKMAMAVDDVVQENLEIHRKTGTGTDVGNGGGTGLVSLSAGDRITLQIQNQDGNEDAGVHSASINLVRIGT